MGQYWQCPAPYPTAAGSVYVTGYGIGRELGSACERPQPEQLCRAMKLLEGGGVEAVGAGLSYLAVLKAGVYM